LRKESTHLTMIRTSIALLLLVLSVSLVACDSGGSDSDDSPGVAQLVGSYDLVSLKDKTGDITTQPDRTLFAGVPNPVTLDLGGGQTFSVTFIMNGRLTLSSTTFTSTFTISTQVDGQSQTETDSSTGTWSIDGQTMTLVDASETDILTWSLVQGRLTLSDSETELVFQRR